MDSLTKATVLSAAGGIAILILSLLALGVPSTFPMFAVRSVSITLGGCVLSFLFLTQYIFPN